MAFLFCHLQQQDTGFGGKDPCFCRIYGALYQKLRVIFELLNGC